MARGQGGSYVQTLKVVRKTFTMLSEKRTQVLDISPRPPKEAGRTVTDDGTGQVGAAALADWLVEQKIL